jgi:hypothetical protein
MSTPSISASRPRVIIRLRQKPDHFPCIAEQLVYFSARNVAVAALDAAPPHALQDAHGLFGATEPQQHAIHR